MEIWLGGGVKGTRGGGVRKVGGGGLVGVFWRGRGSMLTVLSVSPVVDRQRVRNPFWELV